MTLATILLHVLCTAVASAFFISFGEFAIHRHLMHRQRLPRWLYTVIPDLRAQFKNHAILHHGTFYKEFDHEPDPAGKTFNVRILWGDRMRLQLTFLPLTILLGFTISWAAALTFAGSVLIHNYVWGLVHMQMHVPQDNCWFAKTAYFRFISRHHFMHHQNTSKNYNVVLPFADFVLRRVKRPQPSDVRELLRLGHLSPLQPGSASRLERMRADHLAARNDALLGEPALADAAAAE